MSEWSPEASKWSPEASKWSLKASEQPLLDDNWGLLSANLGIFPVTWLLLAGTAGLWEVSLNLNSDDHKRDPVSNVEPSGGQL